MNQTILDFFLRKGTDHKGRTLDDIIAFSNEQLEREHDYIQWLFPSKDPSMFNKHAPLLDDETILEIRDNLDVLKAVVEGWVRMMNFYATSQWISPLNHNYMRISRILATLSLFRLDQQWEYSLMFFLSQRKKNPELISFMTVRFWIEAAGTKI